jgi:hypothetical protein
MNKNKNVLRDMSSTKITPLIHHYFGNYYSVFHKIMLIIILFIGLCVNNIIILIITLIVLTLESYINVSNDNYPFTVLEQSNMICSREKKERKRRKERKNGKEEKELKINSNYFITTQCEIITNVWIFIALKILLIICHNMFMQNIII